jgi:hypothetical protein
MSPGRSNPNIGGNESEYETPTSREDRYDEDISANDDMQDVGNPNYDYKDDERERNSTRYDIPSRDDFQDL